MRVAACCLFLALAGPTTLRAQTPGFQRLPSGTEYQLFAKKDGQYVPRLLAGSTDPTFKDRQGKFLLGHISILTGRDSLLQSSRQQVQNHPVPLPLVAVTRKGGQEEALALVLPGDSAVFRFRADSLFQGRAVPPELKRGGNVLVMRIVGVKLLTQAEATSMQAELQRLAMAAQQRTMRAASAGQFATDDAQIKAYVAAHKLTARRLPQGTWVVITQRGTGPLPKAGETVRVSYRGTLLATGQEFDSSNNDGRPPFEFVLGRGQVITGWDEGIAALPRGSKATLLIPSPLAYGQPGSPPKIPANAVLRFDVGLDGPAAQPLDWVHARMQAKPAAPKAASKKPAGASNSATRSGPH